MKDKKEIRGKESYGRKYDENCWPPLTSFLGRSKCHTGKGAAAMRDQGHVAVLRMVLQATLGHGSS